MTMTIYDNDDLLVETTGSGCPIVFQWGKGGDAFRVVISVTSFHDFTIPILKAFMYFLYYWGVLCGLTNTTQQ